MAWVDDVSREERRVRKSCHGQRKLTYVCLDLPEGVVSFVRAYHRQHARMLIRRRLAEFGMRNDVPLRVVAVDGDEHPRLQRKHARAS